jgi:hypothetical protein
MGPQLDRILDIGLPGRGALGEPAITVMVRAAGQFQEGVCRLNDKA